MFQDMNLSLWLLWVLLGTFSTRQGKWHVITFLVWPTSTSAFLRIMLCLVPLSSVPGNSQVIRVQSLASLPWADPRPTYVMFVFCSSSTWSLLTQYFRDWHLFQFLPYSGWHLISFALRYSLIRLLLYRSPNWVYVASATIWMTAHPPTS